MDTLYINEFSQVHREKIFRTHNDDAINTVLSFFQQTMRNTYRFSVFSLCAVHTQQTQKLTRAYP